MLTRVKVCGITRLEDALAAMDLGAWALGFNFYPKSPRYVSVGRAKLIIGQVRRTAMTVGVFVNPSLADVHEVSAATGITAIQLHGDESGDFCADLAPLTVIKALRLSTAADLEGIERYGRADYILMDAAVPGEYGGTGQLSDWDLVVQAGMKRRLILAGGLTADNVGAACSIAKPFAVDVASGVEESPGKKSLKKMSAFFASARSACESG
ncbi:MAG: phosphoribosylanthranilate isomerase [Acidobacteriales bacterium]|nr:phosphoribosylanthranilate isomerase [Terriglobales bacterium]